VRDMDDSFDAFVSIVRANLTPRERAEAVVYAMEDPAAAGTRIRLPGVATDVPDGCRVAFVDREPSANWGHSARYLLVGLGSSEIRSFEARLPPFQSAADPRWRVIHDGRTPGRG
jgi:hypothetical protein